MRHPVHVYTAKSSSDQHADMPAQCETNVKRCHRVWLVESAKTKSFRCCEYNLCAAGFISAVADIIFVATKIMPACFNKDIQMKDLHSIRKCNVDYCNI